MRRRHHPTSHILNRDAGVIAAAVTHIVDNLEPLGPEIARIMASVPDPLANLRALAKALGEADVHVRETIIKAAERREADSLATAFVVRQRLFAAALTLRAWGALEIGAPENLCRARHQAGVYGNIIALVRMLQGAVEATEKLTPFRADSLERTACETYESLTRFAHRRHDTPVDVKRARDARRAAFLALLDAYDQVRKTVEVIRHAHGDVDQAMPPLRTAVPARSHVG